MSCRKETGDISNDHISDQLVLEPEELVLTDVTARTGLAFLAVQNSSIGDLVCPLLAWLV